MGLLDNVGKSLSDFGTDYVNTMKDRLTNSVPNLTGKDLANLDVNKAISDGVKSSKKENAIDKKNNEGAKTDKQQDPKEQVVNTLKKNNTLLIVGAVAAVGILAFVMLNRRSGGRRR